MGIYTEKEIIHIIKKVEREIFERAEYEKMKNKIISFITEQLKRQDKIMQKEIYKMLPEFDGRTIMPFIKELERNGIIKRIKEKNDYILTLI